MAGIFFYLDTCFRQLHSHIAQIVVGIEIQERGYTMGIDHDVFRTAVGQCQGYGVDDAPFAGAHIEFFHIIDTFYSENITVSKTIPIFIASNNP